MIFDDFIVRAALAALGTALSAGLLGCFVVWRRMAYFGDATAHAAILGVALALATSLPIVLGVLVAAIAMALALDAMERRGQEVNSALGVLSHGALAFGLVGVSLVPGRRVDLEAFLFGDVLTVGLPELALIWIGGVVIVGLLCWHWSALLAATLTPDLAFAAGLDPRWSQRLLTMLIAIVVAVALKVVGALLITALLIIPAAAARGLVRTPEAMAFAAMGIGAVASVGGMGASLWYDTPVGPTIVVCATILFALAQLVRLR